MTADDVMRYIVDLGLLLIAFFGWFRNSKGDSSEQARWMGRIDEKLGNMDKKLDGLDGIPERVESLGERITKLEVRFNKFSEEHGR